MASEVLLKKLEENEEAVTQLLKDMTKLSRAGAYDEIRMKVDMLIMRLDFIEIINKA